MLGPHNTSVAYEDEPAHNKANCATQDSHCRLGGRTGQRACTPGPQSGRSSGGTAAAKAATCWVDSISRLAMTADMPEAMDVWALRCTQA